MRWLGIVMGLALACGCETPTQVVVVLDADGDLVDQIDHARIAVRGGRADEDPLPERYHETDIPLDFPYRIAIVPMSGDASRRYQVEVESFDVAETSLGVVRASGGFTPNRLVEVPLRFESACRDVICDEGFTCRDGACVSDVVDPPDGGDPPIDAGPDAPPPDAGACVEDRVEITSMGISAFDLIGISDRFRLYWLDSQGLESTDITSDRRVVGTVLEDRGTFQYLDADLKNGREIVVWANDAEVRQSVVGVEVIAPLNLGANSVAGISAAVSGSARAFARRDSTGQAFIHINNMFGTTLASSTTEVPPRIAVTDTSVYSVYRIDSSGTFGLTVHSVAGGTSVVGPTELPFRPEGITTVGDRVWIVGVDDSGQTILADSEDGPVPGAAVDALSLGPTAGSELVAGGGHVGQARWAAEVVDLVLFDGATGAYAYTSPRIVLEDTAQRLVDVAVPNSGNPWAIAEMPEGGGPITIHLVCVP